MYVREGLVSTLSHLAHFIRYKSRKPEVQLEKGIIIVSVDVDVGNRKVGEVNKGKNDANVNDLFSEYLIGEIEEQALPLIIDFFNNLEIPVTFAIRGQLLEVDTSIPELLLKSPVKHDIGSHSYYHKDFTKLSREEADTELKLVSATMKKFNISPKTFVFPKNGVAYLDLLEKYEYKCYRGYGDFMNDGMYIKKTGRLYDVHPGLYIGDSTNATLIRRIINLSIRNRLPFHMWFHPWNLGEKKELVEKRINKVFFPLFKYGKSKESKDELKFETMLSAAEKMEITQL